VLQRIVGKLYKVDSIRDWLRLPLRRKGSETVDSLRASLAVVIIIFVPFAMVKVSTFVFLIGFTIYEGFTWTRALDTSVAPGDSKNVFVFFMVGTGICSVFFLYISAVKTVEIMIRNAVSSIDIGDWTTNHSGDPVPRAKSAVTNKTPAKAQIHPPLHQQRRTNRIGAGDLATALDAAAQARVHCVEANRQVAIEYARVSNISSNNMA